jgi:serine phosphatase RsbU (regulator of sigma subunit)
VDHAGDPARVLTAMNRVLASQLTRGFVTAVYAVFDADRRTITVANAGHPPLLVGRSDGTVEAVRDGGVMLGFASDARYGNAHVELRDGDLVLMYTDGVTEARSAAGEWFDPERVERWLTTFRDGDATGFADVALGDLNRWRGRPVFEDDVTFVAARFTPPGPTPS